METLPQEFLEQFFGSFSALVWVFLLIGAIFALLSLLIHIVIVVWIVKDARDRGVQDVVVWALIGFFAGIVGLIVYILTRPQGNLVACEHCGRRRLASLKRCPHCGK